MLRVVVCLLILYFTTGCAIISIAVGLTTGIISVVGVVVGENDEPVYKRVEVGTDQSIFASVNKRNDI